MERVDRNPQRIPPIFDSPFPQELTPDEPIFEYFVCKRVFSILQQLSFATNDWTLNEELSSIYIEDRLLREELLIDSDTSKVMTSKVYKELLSLFQNQPLVTTQSVKEQLEKYQDIAIEKEDSLFPKDTKV